MKEKVPVITFYPIVLFELVPRDKAYARGARFAIQQLDGGVYGFKTRPDAEKFASMHGMNFINQDEMVELRDALGMPRRKS
jgi:hypothetical protein